MIARLLLAGLVALGAAPARAQDGEKKWKLSDEKKADLWPETDLIDAPTAAVVDYGNLGLRGRFSSSGGVLGYLSIGVLQRFNVGASMNVDRLIGTATPVRLRAPAVQLRYRFYDGSRLLPAVAVGFDGQGFFYDSVRRRFNEDKRGVYVVGSHEIGIPGLWLHPGFNISDFDSNAIFFFSGLSFSIEDKVVLMAEWDNVKKVNESRFNAGVRFHVTPFFQLTVAVREIGGTGPFVDGTDHANERVVQMRYVGSF